MEYSQEDGWVCIYYPGCYMPIKGSEKKAIAAAVERFIHVTIAPVNSSETLNEAMFRVKFSAALVKRVGEEEAARLWSTCR